MIREPRPSPPSSNDAEAGDRYLLCSDRLSTVVPPDEVHRLIATIDDPEQAVHALVAPANRSGGPDNVSCVVADVRERRPVDDARPQV